jgi:hypothetical protein
MPSRFLRERFMLANMRILGTWWLVAVLSVGIAQGEGKPKTRERSPHESTTKRATPAERNNAKRVLEGKHQGDPRPKSLKEFLRDPSDHRTKPARLIEPAPSRSRRMYGIDVTATSHGQQLLADVLKGKAPPKTPLTAVDLVNLIDDVAARRYPNQAAVESRIVDRVIALADTGSDECMRFGPHIYLHVRDRMRVVDPVAKRILSFSTVEANRMIGRTLREQVHHHDKTVQFFSAYPAGEKLVFEVNDRKVRLSTEPTVLQKAQLAKTLAEQSAPGSDIIFADQPQLTGAHRQRFEETLYDVATLLQDSERRLLLDDYDGTTEERASVIRKLARNATIAALVDDGSFGTDDEGVIKKVEGQLKDAGIRVVHVSVGKPIGPVGEATAVLITGHSTDILAALVDHLISQDAVRGKPVFLFSCNGRLTRDLTKRMLRVGGAVGVFQFQNAMRVDQVQSLFEGVVRQVKDKNGTEGLARIVEALSRFFGLRGMWRISLETGRIRGTSHWRSASPGDVATRSLT